MTDDFEKLFSREFGHKWAKKTLENQIKHDMEIRDWIDHMKVERREIENAETSVRPD